MPWDEKIVKKLIEATKISEPGSLDDKIRTAFEQSAKAQKASRMAKTVSVIALFIQLLALIIQILS